MRGGLLFNLAMTKVSVLYKEPSLRSKRFLARFVKKTGTRAKKMNDGGGGRE